MSESPVDPRKQLTVIGRGTGIELPNRFERIHVEPEFEHLDVEDQQAISSRKVATEYYMDASQSIVTRNDSPDIIFRYSINPYRGCIHGCSYCYARPYHEFIGLSAGLDFESRILVKPDAAPLFRKWLGRGSWQCEPVNLSGITDPYQPAERKFGITRQCLEVAVECRQPMYVITKNALVTRDLDLLARLASDQLVRVVMTVTSLDAELIRRMEPGTSTPPARLRAIRQLTEHEVPVVVNVAPIIIGLTDHEIPDILQQVADAGAIAASYTLLRLPGAVEPIFLDWLERHFPDRQTRIENGIRSVRKGQLGSSEFFDRMRGSGVMADHVRSVFKTFARKYQLDHRPAPLTTDLFRKPTSDPSQKWLFND